MHDVGLLLHVPGIMALVSLLISVGFNEPYGIPAFLGTALLSILLAQLCYRISLPKLDETRLYHAMLTAAVAWCGISLVGAIPFLSIAWSFTADSGTQSVLVFQNLWNALFESFSGFTGTGLSVTPDPSQLPHSLQWWRSFTEWVDGVGVIILVLAVLKPEVEPFQLYAATGRRQTLTDTVASTAKQILWIYGFYTALSILLLWLLGMTPWAAINHGLTGISTGGFSITENSLSPYSPLIQLAVVVIMITGAVSFPMHYKLLRHRDWSAFWHSQHRLLLFLLGLGTVGILLENRWSSGVWLWVDSLFQWTSALTTCGFATVTVQDWNATTKLLLSGAMLIGGAAGSTVGGLKLNRVLILFQGVRWRLKQLWRTLDRTTPFQLNGEELTLGEAQHKVQVATILTLLWLVLLSLGCFGLAHVVSAEYGLEDVIVEVTSATSNVGLSTGISAPELHWSGKLILILLMWIGRLEIIPVLLLVTALLAGKSGQTRKLNSQLHQNTP